MSNLNLLGINFSGMLSALAIDSDKDWQGYDITNLGGLSVSSLTQGSVVFSGPSGLLSEDSSNLFWNDTDKRLGIGTNSPTDPLHIDAGTQADNTKEVPLYIEKSGIGTITHWHQNKSAAQTYWWLTTVDTGTNLWSDGLIFGFDIDNSVALWNYENTPFKLATSGTERLRIFADGDVEIKSEGDTPLRVLSSSSERFKLTSDGDMSIYGDVDTQSSELRLLFSGTEKFKITSNGNVSLYGDVDTQSSGVTITVSETERFKIYGEGDVKITSSGTISNAARLQIRGPSGGSYGNMISVHSTAASGQNNVYIKFTNNDTGESMWSDGFLFGIDTDESVVFWNYEDTALRIATNGTERFRILGNGDIGIRTTTPTSSLDINGTNGYDQFRLRTSYTPTATSDSNGSVGDIAWDSSYIYVKTSAGWKRATLLTF